jgi:hypothetical protein
MSDELLELIPEFAAIEDEDLRKRVMAVWAEAMQIGDWSPERLKRIPFTLLAEDVKVSFIEHVRTVCRMCIAMADVLIEAYGERVSINKDHLVAGALLTDVGKLLEFVEEGGELKFSKMYNYLRHPFTGVGLCFRHDIPPEVMHLVAVHSWEGDKFKRRPEAIILHHADFTDFDLVRFK